MMKKIKRLLCIYLAVILLPINMIVLADTNSGVLECEKIFTTTKKLPEDVIDTEYEVAVSFLQAFGLYDSANISPWDEVTRQEMVEYTVKTLRPEYTGTQGITYFYDVPSTSEYAAYINAAVEYGYVDGVGDGYFHPETLATYEQFAKVLSIATGYNMVASHNGGYVEGYVQNAHQVGIMENISKGIGQTITRGEFAIMLYNTLHSNAYVMDYSSSVSQSMIQGEAMMTELFNIKQTRGILQATDSCSIYEDKKANDGYVLINGYQYLSGEIDAEGFLGYELEVYYVDGKDDKTIVAVRPTNKNTVYEVDYEDISPDSTINTIKYRPNETSTKTKSIKVALVADFVYNGLGMSSFANEDIILDNGCLIAIDNNGDGNSDVVRITEYENYVVNAIDVSGEKIYEKYGKPQLELYENYADYKIFKSGKEIELSTLKKWDVVSTYVTKNSIGDKKVELEVSTDSITGTVTGITRGKNYITVDGADLYIAENISKMIDGGNMDQFKVGNSYKFYLDAEGRIAAVDKAVSTGEQYGLVLKMFADENEEIASIKLYTQNGVFEQFTLPKKIKYNGKKKDSVSAIKEFKTAVEAEATPVKLVKYMLDENGAMTELTSYYSTNNDAKITRDIIYNEDVYTYASSFLTRSTRESMGGNDMYALGTDTLIFNVPETFATASDDGNYEEKEFALLKKTDLATGPNYIGTQVYETPENSKVAGVVCLKMPISDKFSSVSKLFCVNDIYQEYDEAEGEVVNVIEGYTNGKQTKIIPETPEIFANIQVGDIIQPLQNSLGKVKVLKVIFRHGDVQPTAANGSEYTSTDRDGTVRNITQVSGINNKVITVDRENYTYDIFIAALVTSYGTVDKVESSGFSVKIGANKFLQFYNPVGCTYYICEKTRNGSYQYSVGSINDMFEGAKVMVHSRTGNTRDVFIFKQ